MAQEMKTYTVRYERDHERWWVASVPAVKGCHTQGRTIEEARRRIREALDLFVADADTAELRDDVRLPSTVRTSILRAQRTRQRADAEQLKAITALRVTVRTLRKEFGLSVRDAGRLLGITGQRVHQLESSTGKG